MAFTFDILSDAKIEEDYRVPVIFDGRKAGPGGRQTPTVKPPAESDLAVVHFQLPGLVYSSDYDYLMTLKGAPSGMGGSPESGGTPKPGGTNGPKGPSMPGPAVGDGGGFNAGRSFGTQFGRGLKGRGFIKDRNSAEEKGEHDYDIEWKKVADIQSLTGAIVARQPVPVRAAEIVAGFPYKAQLAEFKEKLGLPSEEAVLAEAAVAAKDDKTPVHTFRFLGFLVERRQVDALGRPIDAQGAVVTAQDGGWGQPLDLQDAYAPLIVLSGGEANLEKETRFYKVAIAGLTLPKLPTAGQVLRQPPVDEYPDLEDNLPLLKKTVDDLDKTPGADVAKPAFSKSPGNIFDLPPAAGTNGPGAGSPFPGGTGGPRFPGGGPGGTGGPSSLGPPPGATRPPPGSTGFPGVGDTPGAGTPAPGPGQLGVIPDYCLIRMFDFTIEPGKTYEYRMKVRMANPNYERKDVASQGIAADPELTPKEWYVLPKKLTVPSDLYYYAVDQAKLDQNNKDKDKGPKLPTQPVAVGTQTVLQVQKWVDYLTLKSRTELPVGDWVVAERVVATRGEPIGRQRVEVPYWRKAQDRYTMATDQPPPKENDKKYVASVEVALTPDGKEPILVDFQKTGAAYTRTHPRTEDAAAPADPAQAVEDTQAPEEVLLYTADGRLLSHNAARDAVDPDRVKRLDEVRTWIKAVKDMKNGVKDDKLFNDRPNPSN